MNRGYSGIAALVAALVLACGVTVVLPLLGTSTAKATCAIPGRIVVSPGVGGAWNSTARQHAATIVEAGARQQIPPRGWVIAVATAMAESSLRNLANTAVPRSLQYPHDAVATDHDSLGLFQQRPSPPDGTGSWGTVADIMNPATSAAKFYTVLQRVDGWQRMRLTDAAQAVQRSATPEAFQEHEQAAEQLVAAVAGVDNIDQIGGGSPLAPCGPGGIQPVPIGPLGWTQPVTAKVVSPYGPRDGRLHAGVDLGATRHTPIRAASAGVVTKVRCDSSTGTCDRDGSPQVGGCGWMVEVHHAVNLVYGGIRVVSVTSRYCHMVQRPEVTVGDQVAAGAVLGFVGSSGRSSGPHLHYELHLNVPIGQSLSALSSTDPEPLMAAVGATLGLG